MTKFHHEISRGSERSVDYPRFSQTTVIVQSSYRARDVTRNIAAFLTRAASTLREEEEFENAALFLRLGLPSTLIRQGNALQTVGI